MAQCVDNMLAEDQQREDDQAETRAQTERDLQQARERPETDRGPDAGDRGR